MEGGIYVKVIRLSPEKEPILYHAIRKPRTILENVVLDRHGVVQFDDASKTENTRATCPIQNIPQWEASRKGPPPKAFVFLVCDAFGVLPPVSVLSPTQAAYHFILAYTAKVAGTERGVLKPTATFSTCFGAAFMPFRGQEYATMLCDRLQRHGTRVFLVNTGWAGGSAASGAPRMDLRVSRTIIDAISTDQIDTENLQAPDPIFGLRVPRGLPGVDARLLNPATFWPDPGAYQRQARELAALMQAEYMRKRYNPEWAVGGPVWSSEAAQVA
jgi:phosphoenolpyruvate carboxykinase (ATP)